MEGLQNRRSILNTTLITAGIFSVVLSIGLLGHLKGIEKKFRQEKTTLVKQNIEFKDKFDSLNATYQAKMQSVTVLETERDTLMGELSSIKKKYEELVGRANAEMEALRRENRSLKDETDIFKKVSLTQMIKEALDTEKNDNVKRVLEEAMTRIDMIKAGKSVALEPILVTGSDAGGGGFLPGRSASVMSVDAKNNLIVIGLGRSDNIREGQRCFILRDNNEIGSAEVIRTRHKISAAFIDKINHGYTMRDIKEGYKVIIK